MKQILFIILLTAFSFAQLSSENASFEHNISARAMAMGESFTAVSNDASAVLWNAAAMFQEESMSYGATYTKHFGLIPAFSLYGKYVYDDDLSFGGMIKNDGDDLYSETEINAAVAYDLYDLTYIDQLYVGLNLHYRHNSSGSDHEGINYVTFSGNGFGFDFSMFYKISKNVNIGFKVNNFIDSFKWNSENQTGESNSTSESAATDFRFGIAYQDSKFSNFSMEYRTAFDEFSHDRIYIGIEESIQEVIILRAGYARNLSGEHDNENVKYGFGIGVIVNPIAVNYSYQINHIENVHFVGLDVNL